MLGALIAIGCAGDFPSGKAADAGSSYVTPSPPPGGGTTPGGGNKLDMMTPAAKFDGFPNVKLDAGRPKLDVQYYKPLTPNPYQGSTFGCRADSDCFGQKCCHTPWGVRLCAPSCPSPSVKQ
jgi:hypothetical protein